MTPITANSAPSTLNELDFAARLGKKQRLSLKGPLAETEMPNVAFHGGNSCIYTRNSAL
jgi:hypothetical protein